MATKYLLRMTALVLIALVLGCSSGSGPTEPGNGGTGGGGSNQGSPPPAPTNFTSQRVPAGVMFSWEIPDPTNTAGCHLQSVYTGVIYSWECNLPATVTQACDSITPVGQMTYSIYAYDSLGRESETVSTSIYVLPLVSDVVEPLSWEGAVMTDLWGGSGMLSFQVAADSSLTGTLMAKLWGPNLGGGLYPCQSPTVPITGEWNGNNSIQINVPATIDTTWEIYVASFPLQFTFTNKVEAEFTLSGRVYYQGSWYNSNHTYEVTCTSSQ